MFRRSIKKRGHDSKIRCPKCRKKRTFSISKSSQKPWSSIGIKMVVCCFCAAKEAGTLDQLQSDLANLRKLRRKERVGEFNE